MTSYSSIEQMLVATAEGVRPPERLSVAEAAVKYRMLNNPGSYIGPWTHEITPYLVEPMEVLTSTDYTGMVFVGPAQCGKALALDTPIPTPSGWSSMGALRVGDQIFGSRGQVCEVVFATETMTGRDCYEVVFDDGTKVIADAEHKWKVDDVWGGAKVLTTEQMLETHITPLKYGRKTARYSIPLAGAIQGEDKVFCTDPYSYGKRMAQGRACASTEYLRGSIAQRKALLTGLIEGKSTTGRVFLSTYNPFLYSDIKELLTSLSIKYRVGIAKGKDRWDNYEEGYQLSFSLCENPKIQRRWIRAINPIESVPVRCIQVDSPDSLFLAGEGMVPTHNTDMLLNWITHSAICDPADMMVVQTAISTARDFSRRRIDRLFRHTPAVGERLVPRKDADNVLDKMFRSGMYLTLSWPSVNELAGKPIPRLWITDYDRIDTDIGGDGSAFDLCKKRTTTFGRYGMTAAESSPSFPITNPQWLPRTPHEAPPTQGILALYNRGDRRRYLWRCPTCRNAFEPDFGYLSWPDTADMMEAAEVAAMACPHCGCLISHESRKGVPGKYELNIGGKWLKDGQKWGLDGRVTGTPYRSDIASFWLKGVCAGFADWRTLVFNYLKARDEYERTGSDSTLKTTINTDQGVPYSPKTVDGGILPEVLKSRAKDLGQKVVPLGVRFMLATVDIQKSRFAVKVIGFGAYGDMWVVDRFDIRKSKRLDGDGERWPVSPGAYPEDWQVLIDEVLQKTYPLADMSNRVMQIKAMGSDSGGKEGVTTNAYKFYRYLRDNPDGGHDPNCFRRFQLIKGAERKNSAPRVQISYPDSDRKDRHAGARGDVPVLLINSDQIKDWASKILQRTDPNGGQLNFPDWLPDDYYTELTVEVRTGKGWDNPKKARNEAWDLLCYALALSISPLIRMEQIDWEKPPKWAEEWDHNDLVSLASENSRFEAKPKARYDLAQIGREMA